MSVSRRLAAALVVLSAAGASAQDVPFTSSNLPVVLIDTDGQTIPDEPKITARMRIVDNGPGQRNAVTDEPTGYDGFIGIEVRGFTSQSFPKKQYGVETRDADGENRNVSLLGMPKENDWVLYAPYVDKSLMRNVLTYDLARAAGRYASRTRFCEVVLDGEYQGVYVLLEKVKRDDNRVDVNKLKPDETEGDDLTGGYVFRLDREDESDGWYSPYAEPGMQPYQFVEPDADDVAPEQAAYIRSFMDAFERAMASDDRADPETGYPAIVDVGSFADFVIWNELGKNYDAYRLSTYLHKDKDSNDPRLHAGPVWDFNIAYGNTGLNGANVPEGTFVDGGSVLPWWGQLVNSGPFRAAAAERWAELRGGLLGDGALDARVDSMAALLGEAQARNFERWPVLGRQAWDFDAPGWADRETYAAEVDYLRAWLDGRTAWLDAVFFARPVAAEAAPPPAGVALSAPAPNPARGRSRLTLTLARAQDVAVDVVDVRGRVVARLLDGPLAAGAHDVTVPTSELPAGVYLVRARGASAGASRRVVVAGR